MRIRGMRRWLEVGTAALALVVCQAAGTLPSVVLAVPADDPEMGKPAAMELQAVTLELRCREPLAEGVFHAVHAGLSMPRCGRADCSRPGPTRGAFPGCPAAKRKPTGRPRPVCCNSKGAPRSWSL